MALRATTMHIKALVRVWEYRYPIGRRSYCSNCGKLAIMEDFCSKCGAKVMDGNSTEERKEYHDNTTSFPLSRHLITMEKNLLIEYYKKVFY